LRLGPIERLGKHRRRGGFIAVVLREGDGALDSKPVGWDNFASLAVYPDPGKFLSTPSSELIGPAGAILKDDGLPILWGSFYWATHIKRPLSSNAEPERIRLQGKCDNLKILLLSEQVLKLLDAMRVTWGCQALISTRREARSMV
jgi:hypothetical protein